MVLIMLFLFRPNQPCDAFLKDLTAFLRSPTPGGVIIRLAVGPEGRRPKRRKHVQFPEGNG